MTRTTREARGGDAHRRGAHPQAPGQGGGAGHGPHAAGLAAGGTDEGAPGLRYSPTFYSCYVRDPDGNKLSAVCDRAE